MEPTLTPITVAVTVHAPIEKVWASFTEPAHIRQWCQASADWHAPRAENDLRVGGTFLTAMAAKDGSAGFDFTGEYTEVMPLEKIAYTITGGRRVSILFASTPEGVIVTETFDPETENSAEMQRGGWQAILESFKTYTEGLMQLP